MRDGNGQVRDVLISLEMIDLEDRQCFSYQLPGYFPEKRTGEYTA
jgi:hypothetical protein